MTRPSLDKEPFNYKLTGGLAISISVAAALVLYLMGQPIHCECGSFSPWAGDIWSSHNSQHLFDPYSFTHVSHGIIFFWVLALVLPKWKLGSRFLLSLGLEALWEIVENSPPVIEHYRANTISLDYYGDSVINSLGDLLSCSLGFFATSLSPLALGLPLFLILELSLLFTIRDNLVLNVANLLGDFPTLVEWQSKIKP